MGEAKVIELNAEIVSAFYRFFPRYMEGQPEKCWHWLGNFDDENYPRLSVRGKYYRAHRLSWMIYNHISRLELPMLHSCDNPPCVNPFHLFPGTNVENVKDRNSKGRQASGEFNGGGGKLNWAIVHEIKEELKEGKSYRSLSIKYGVSRRIIRLIDIGQLWRE